MNDRAGARPGRSSGRVAVAAFVQPGISNIGQRSALERMAPLLLELFHRIDAVGLTANGACALPLTQAEIAEAMGMTLVHADRMLQEMRTMGLIELSNRRLQIRDMAALSKIAQFNADYLHLKREGSSPDANDRAPFAPGQGRSSDASP